MTVSELVRPDFYTRPDYSVTLGPEVAELGEMVGYTPYLEQAMLLDDTFALDPNDSSKSAAFEVAAIAARQQLKTGFLKLVALGWLFVTEEPLVIWSAHEFPTALQAQVDLIGLIESNRDLASKVESTPMSGAAGYKIVLKSKAELRFKARTSGGGRGLTGNKIIMDEAFALQAQHLGALLPTLTAVPDPQIVYGSSAGLLKSDALRAIRDRGRPGAERLVYAEWGSDKRACASEVCTHRPGAEGCALDDRDAWRRACFISFRNDPSMETVQKLRDAMPPEEFAREMLVWWDDPAGDGAMNLDKWNDLEVSVPEVVKQPWFGIDVSPGQAFASIAAAGRLEGGTIQGELTIRDGVIDHRPGIDWVRSRVAEIRENVGDFPFAYAVGGGLESIVPGLLEDGVQLVPLSARDVAASCGNVMTLVNSGGVSHLGQADLTDAVKVARIKDRGESAFVWVRDGFADLSPLYAFGFAVWQAGAAQDPAANVW